MAEWGVALIAAGAAIVSGVVTGWYGRSAGLRQAEAARQAAVLQAEAARQASDRQAEALLASVRMTLRAEADHRALALRRRTYADFLAAAEDRILAERGGRGPAEGDAPLQRALGAVLLEGPSEAVEAARHLVDCLRRHEKPDEVRRAKLAFVAVARGCSRGDGEREP
ncbi:hypothetical protein AB0O07_26960 [Streptomyces sp. NPDC093085]|uniref:hypothetical protein n=1 Tax=Streptomyces sp. NPDC093085 TaxID=3155068 RepID=UPI00341F4ED4